MREFDKSVNDFIRFIEAYAKEHADISTHEIIHIMQSCGEILLIKYANTQSQKMCDETALKRMPRPTREQ